jgi:hypothetical protein
MSDTLTCTSLTLSKANGLRLRSVCMTNLEDDRDHEVYVRMIMNQIIRENNSTDHEMMQLPQTLLPLCDNPQLGS